MEHISPRIAYGKQDIPEGTTPHMPDCNRWVVLHATEVNSPQIQVPKAVAERIGLRADLPEPGSGLAFLDQGPGVLQVVALARNSPSWSLAKGQRIAVPNDPAHQHGSDARGHRPRGGSGADPSAMTNRGLVRGVVAVATPTKKLVFSLPKRVRLHLRLGRRDIVAWVAPAGAAKGRPVLLVKSAFQGLLGGMG